MKIEEFKTSVALSEREVGLKLSVYWGKDFGELLTKKGWTHFLPEPRISCTLYGTLIPYTQKLLFKTTWPRGHFVKFQRKAGGVVHAEIPMCRLGLVVGFLGRKIETTSVLHAGASIQLRTPSRTDVKNTVDQWIRDIHDGKDV